MDWSYNNLAGCDLVHNVWMECLTCISITFYRRDAVMGTLILLGAGISNGLSSAFLFVLGGASDLSRSMGSILRKWLTDINGEKAGAFNRALHKEALVKQFILRSAISRNKPTTKIAKWLNHHLSSCCVLSFHIQYGMSSTSEQFHSGDGEIDAVAASAAAKT